MTDRIRWGVLATGGIAGAFVEDLRQLSDAEAVAVGSRTPEAAERFADRYGIPRAYGTWAELAADPDIDVVYVATPHSAHHAATSLCLAAGRAVLCEKPFTVNVPEAERLVALARDRGVFLMEAMWMNTNPAIRRLVELVGEGAIGEVRAVHADFGLAGPFDAAHRLRSRELGGGALLDLGVYPVALAHLVLGPPEAVSAWGRLTPEGVDETTGMLFGYESGAVALLGCSIAADTPRMAAISGTRGRIELPRAFYRAREFVLHRDGRRPEVVTVPFAGEGYVYEAAEVARCLRAGLTESPLVPWAATISVMRVLDTVRAQIGVTYPADLTS